MMNSIKGYLVLVVVYAIGVYAITMNFAAGNVLLLSIPACLAVLLALICGSVSEFGVALTLILFNFILPLIGMYAMGSHVGFESPVQEISKHFEWVKMSIVVCVGLLTYVLIDLIKKRLADYKHSGRFVK